MAYSQDLLESTNQELDQQLLQARQGLFQLRNEFEKAKKIAKPHRLREFRKQIARILTLQQVRKSQDNRVLIQESHHGQ